MVRSLVGCGLLVSALISGCGSSNPAPAIAARPVGSADAGAPTPAVEPPPAPIAGAPTSITPIFAKVPAFVASKRVTKKTDPAWSACHASFKASTKDVSAEVSKLAQGCAAATKMKQIGTTLKATQDEHGPHHEYKLKALAGHCYRAYLQSDATIKDLGLMIKDSAGDTGTEDNAQGTSLVQDGASCFKEADDALVVVSVGQGKGTYALQIWGD